MTKFLLFIIVGILAVADVQAADARFPQGPDPILTPGQLCHSKSRVRRYKEQIPYCPRDVSSGEKRDIIRTYDQARGFQVSRMPRGQFKIDHYIPLCAGGSNERDNLWPQHESIYTVTDPLEAIVCEKLAQGRIAQAQAIRLIKTGKADLSQVAALVAELRKL